MNMCSLGDNNEEEDSAEMEKRAQKDIGAEESFLNYDVASSDSKLLTKSKKATSKLGILTAHDNGDHEPDVDCGLFESEPGKESGLVESLAIYTEPVSKLKLNDGSGISTESVDKQLEPDFAYFESKYESEPESELESEPESEQESEPESETHLEPDFEYINDQLQLDELEENFLNSLPTDSVIEFVENELVALQQDDPDNVLPPQEENTLYTLEYLGDYEGDESKIFGESLF